MLAEKKISEGTTLLKQADKLTQKTLTRWKPDWEGAATLFEQAATCFKNAKAFERARTAYEKAAHAYTQSKLLHSAARLTEAAASMAKEDKLPLEACKLYEQAALLYRENGSSVEQAADCLIKAARVAEEQDDMEQAGALAEQAVELFETEERLQFAIASFKYGVSVHLKRRNVAAAVALQERLCAALRKLQQGHEFHKQALSLVILLVHSGDSVAADRRWQQFADESDTGFATSTEGRLAAEILEACTQSNPEMLQQCMQRQTISFLDNQVARLAKTLKLPDLSPDGGLA